MEESKKTFQMPKSSIRYLLICLGGVALVIVIGILPMWYAMTSLDKQEKDLVLRIEEQEQLAPLYQVLQKKVSDRKVSVSLPMPARTRVQKEQVDQVSVAVKGLAGPLNWRSCPSSRSWVPSGGTRRWRRWWSLSRRNAQFRNFITALGGCLTLNDSMRSRFGRPRRVLN